MRTSTFHAAVMVCAILLSSLFPSEPGLAQGCPAPSFGPPNWFDAGASLDSVAVGDFNGDGKLDLAVADPNSGTVSVLLGNGDGTFPAAASYHAGVNPISIAVGDFNRDGKLDLVVANRGLVANDFADSSVSVLLGNSDGTFQTPVNYGPGMENRFDAYVAVGDFNGDAKPDLVVGITPSGGGGVVTILLNTCVSAGPALTIARTNSTLAVSWPFPSTGFVLESTPSLRPPNWQPAIETPLTNNALLEVMVPIKPGSRYFRLHQP
jgi:hypothetical protein